jgi:acetyltransferase-like isoleucine patch superfamily enzyme
MDIFSLHQLFVQTVARLYTALARRSLARCGQGTLILFPTRIDNPSRIEIGCNTVISQHCFIVAPREYVGEQFSGRVIIGDKVIIGRNVQISAIQNVRIGNNVGLAPGCIVSDHIHDYIHPETPIMYGPLSSPKPVVIEDDCFIGANTIVAPGAHIGRHAFIGGNSVVTKDIPPYCMAAGNPARVLRRYDHDRRQWVSPR